MSQSHVLINILHKSSPTILSLIAVCHDTISTYWQAGTHALHIAGIEGNTEMAKILLRAGVTIDEVVC